MQLIVHLFLDIKRAMQEGCGEWTVASIGTPSGVAFWRASIRLRVEALRRDKWFFDN
jgi:hypothetical protein